MAIDPLTARLVQALTATGAVDTSLLRPGQQIDARILALGANDSLKVATRFGLLDLHQSILQSILGGQSALASEAQKSGGQSLIGATLKLVVGATDGTEGQGALKLVSVDQRPATADTTRPAPPQGDQGQARIIAEETARAAAHQDGLAPVYANASRLAASDATLPPPLKDAISQLAALSINGDQPVSAEDVRSSINSSGLFLEARLAQANGSAEGLAGSDLKAALYALKGALGDFLASSAPATAAPASEAPLTSSLQGGPTPPIQEPSAAPTGSGVPVTPNSPLLPGTGAGEIDTEALAAVLRPPPTVSPQSAGSTSTTMPAAAVISTETGTAGIGAPLVASAPSSGQAPSPAATGLAMAADMTRGEAETLFAMFRPPPTSGAGTAGTTSSLPGSGQTASAALIATGPLSARPDLATMAALGELIASETTPSGRRVVIGKDGRPELRKSADDGTLPPQARPAPPQRGVPPHGQPAADSPDPAGASSRDVAETLVKQTDSALARVTLGQIASLPDAPGQDPAPATPQAPHQGSWLFEVPVVVGGKTSIAQFEIDSEQEGATTADPAERNWKVRFSLDIAPVGPVHARLTLANHRLSLGVWTERPDAAAAMAREAATLRQSLGDLAVSIDEIHLYSGKPPAGPPARAGGFIDRNA